MKLRHLLILIVVAGSACSQRIEYPSAPNATAASGTVNINTAGADELEKLPHIGRKTAESIVEFRNTNGSYRRPEDILLIRGISETRFADIRPLIRVE